MKLLENNNIKNYFSGCLTVQIDFYNYYESDKIIYNDIDKNKIDINENTELTTAYFIPENLKNCNAETLHLNSIKNLQSACNYLKNFCKCKNIITSRLHCYMPCIGLNIPCDFTSPDLDKNKQTWSLGNRFEGLIFDDNNNIIPRQDYIKIKEMQQIIINFFMIKSIALYF